MLAGGWVLAGCVALESSHPHGVELIRKDWCVCVCVRVRRTDSWIFSGPFGALLHACCG